MKRLIACLLILLALNLTASAETLGWGFVNSTDVALRRGVGGKILTRLPEGTCVWINDTHVDSNGKLWYEIAAGLHIDYANYDFAGWMMAAFIDAGETVWHDIAQIAADSHGLIALRSDGSTETAGRLVVAMDGSAWVSPKDWADSYGRAVHVGIPSNVGNEYFIVTENNEFVSSVNGIRVAEGMTKANAYENLPEMVYAPQQLADDLRKRWETMAQICIEEGYALGLKNDGTVVCESFREGAGMDVSNWQDIVAIDSGNDWCVGLKKDGTLVFAGNHIIMNEGHWRK